MQFSTFRHNGLAFDFIFSPEMEVKVLDVTSHPYNPETDPKGTLLKWARLVELQTAECDRDDHHGHKYTGTMPGGLLRYESHAEATTELGPKLAIRQAGGGLSVTSHLQFLGALPIVRSWTTVQNVGPAEQLVEYVSAFALAGISHGGAQSWSDKMRLHVADNTWCGECQWRNAKLRQFGLTQGYASNQTGFGLNRVSISNQGTWSSMGFLPMGALENTEAGQIHFWQIEHNGSWQWEVSDMGGELYVRLSGPTYRESLWSRKLQPGQTLESVPASFGRTEGGLPEALQVLTQARRLIRRPHPDLLKLPVIFNDYMNCLCGDPSEAALKPIIEAAAAVGSEYFVIDAGWYAEKGKSWWDTVGEWQPSATRFPNGLATVMEFIRQNNMVPGLWLEIEVMGINCPLARQLPDSWFFQHEGRRVIDHGRYQLDFRNPEVRAHAREVVDRLVRDFGIGYLKMDYNINAGPGTDFQADSTGDGLLAHNRAYLAWITEIFGRYPELVIENCASGGLRIDYAQLAVHSIQSVSDQTDYRLNGLIAAACASAVTPEQAAVWSYPLRDGSEEETIFNMVNTLLFRIHQSGHLHEISPSRLALVTEGITLYKHIRTDIPSGAPFWPLGLPQLSDGWAAFGLEFGSHSLLAVWRLGSQNESCTIPLHPRIGHRSSVHCLYPRNRPVPIHWTSENLLEVTMPIPNSARLFELKPS